MSGIILPGFDILGFIPYDASIIQADLQNSPRLDASPQINLAAKEIFNRLIQQSIPLRA